MPVQSARTGPTAAPPGEANQGLAARDGPPSPKKAIRVPIPVSRA